MCSHQGGHALELLQPRHHGPGRQLLQPLQDSWLPLHGKEDAKKTDNSVVKVKGCLIDAHVDINNLPPFPSDYQILIVLQCDDQLGKVDHGENNPAQK